MADFIYEVNGGLEGVVVVNLEDAIARGFIDRGELVETTRLRLEMLDVHLDRLAWDTELWPSLWAWPVTLLGHAGDAVLA